MQEAVSGQCTISPSAEFSLYPRSHKPTAISCKGSLASATGFGEALKELKDSLRNELPDDD